MISWSSDISNVFSVVVQTMDIHMNLWLQYNLGQWTIEVFEEVQSRKWTWSSSLTSCHFSEPEQLCDGTAAYSGAKSVQAPSCIPSYQPTQQWHTLPHLHQPSLRSYTAAAITSHPLVLRLSHLSIIFIHHNGTGNGNETCSIFFPHSFICKYSFQTMNP